MLIDKLGDVVDLVVDNHVKVILGVVLRNVLVGELGGHVDGCFVGDARRAGWIRDSACWMRNDKGDSGEDAGRLRRQADFVDGKVGTAGTEREGGGK